MGSAQEAQSIVQRKVANSVTVNYKEGEAVMVKSKDKTEELAIAAKIEVSNHPEHVEVRYLNQEDFTFGDSVRVEKRYVRKCDRKTECMQIQQVEGAQEFETM